MRIARTLVSVAAASLAALLAPDTCAACAQRVPMRTVFCPPCAATLVAATPARDPSHAAAFAYGGALARAITAFKYENRPDLARPLASVLLHGLTLLASRAGGRESRGSPDVVVPVPLHPMRLVARGYNQAALLARPVAHSTGARFEPRALLRTRDTAAQALLDRDARLANVARAFRAPDRGRLAGARVLLVDDVRTTGATLRACAAALSEAGAREVTAVVVASADT